MGTRQMVEWKSQVDGRMGSGWPNGGARQMVEWKSQAYGRMWELDGWLNGVVKRTAERGVRRTDRVEGLGR
nr:hypothetical protein Iba_chr12bCG18650 [Ipomoea batatas]